MPVVNRHLPGASTIRGKYIKSSLFQIQCDIVQVERQPFNYSEETASWGTSGLLARDIPPFLPPPTPQAGFLYHGFRPQEEGFLLAARDISRGERLRWVFQTQVSREHLTPQLI